MKKLGKGLLALLLCAVIGTGGFILGQNTEQFRANTSAQGADGQERILKNIEAYEKVIQDDFLFDYDEKDLEAGIYKGLFAGLGDPYSEYYTPEEYQRLMEDTSGKFAGVGLVITAGEDNLITVVSPIANTPAAKAGLQAGDKIIEVDGEPYSAAELQEATQKMRGPEGTQVEVTVTRKTKDKLESKHVQLKREMISVESVVGKLLDDQVGYVQITSFDEDTAKQFKETWEKLEGEGAERFVLDLRNNPGGLLTSCEEIADMLLGKGIIVSTVDSHGQEEVARSDADHYTEKLVLLVNQGSASASEILTGALRDNQRALSIGETTFGKGIVQRLYPLGQDGSEGGFKLTMAEYLTPNGEKIHGKGIQPDIQVSLPQEVRQIGPDHLDQDSQLQRALEEVNK